ncbi:hypothetical protein ABZS83_33010 [Streptomyces sp. NPDC005426]|uniref:hypothetical protein n=1 Tax=Streptomyces sp. NPDC005426 TaxID=3155344 RepID=UPI0033A1C7A8
MSRVLTTITAADIEEHREALCQWAEANKLDPKDVAAGPGLTVERTGRRTSIVYQEIQRGADGRALVDPSTPDEVWTVRKATPLISPLDDHGYPAADDHGAGHSQANLTLGDQTPGEGPPP